MQRISLISLILLLLILLTCEERTEGPVDFEFPPPKLAFSPDTLYFTLPGDPVLPGMKVAKTIRLWNAGAGSLPWTLSEHCDWLTIEPTAGVCGDATDTIDASALFDMIGDGELLSGDINITTGTGVTTITAVASKYIDGRICASESTLVLTAKVDSAPKTLQVRACGHCESSWRVGQCESWIQVSPDSGSSSGEWQQLTVAIDWLRLTAYEERTGSFTLDGPNDIDITVRIVWPEPLLCLSGADLITLSQDADPGPVYFRVARCSPGAPIEWTVEADAPWVILSPHSGSSAGEWDRVSVSVDWSIDWLEESDLMSNISVTGGGDTLAKSVLVSPPCQIAFIEPTADTEWVAGNWEMIRWKQVSAGPDVTLYLFKGNRIVKYFRDGHQQMAVINDGEYLGLASTAEYPSGSDYYLEIHSGIAWPTCWARSENFTIIVPECYVWVEYPNITYQYQPGDTMNVHWWTHAPAAEVAIDLYQDGSLVCNIVQRTENDRIFSWPVEQCGTSGDTYQVKVTDVADPDCGGFSEPFQIEF